VNLILGDRKRCFSLKYRGVVPRRSFSSCSRGCFYGDTRLFAEMMLMFFFSFSQFGIVLLFCKA
jgi:hypothetical protein